MMFANPNICFIWDERLREWRHTTADRIISGLMGNYQSAKGRKQKIIARYKSIREAERKKGIKKYNGYPML